MLAEAGDVLMREVRGGGARGLGVWRTLDKHGGKLLAWLDEGMGVSLAIAHCSGSSSPQAWQEVTLANEGKVKRHTLRGNTELTPKEVRNEEDLVSTAGCRNPAKVYGGPQGTR